MYDRLLFHFRLARLTPYFSVHFILFTCPICIVVLHAYPPQPLEIGCAFAQIMLKLTGYILMILRSPPEAEARLYGSVHRCLYLKTGLS